MNARIERMQQLRARTLLGGGEKQIEVQHARGKLTARERLDLLLDEGSFVEIDRYVEHSTSAFGMDDKRIPGDGVVTRAGRTAGYGKTVDLSHGFGYRTRYGHMSEVLVKPGQRVRRGDPVGRVGSTGRSTGPHLHYEVFREGRHVNPWEYLGDRK